ncbi:methionyl-tRNA formyltransferase [Patescibacteria group bacterium]|nr:methionyl-tRNA formyltransferase [Patescibacteria group bacterium]
MDKDKLKIIFFGTPEFSVKILEAMDKNGFTLVAVVTTPDKPKGRKLVLTPSPVKLWAQEHNVRFLQPTLIKDLRIKIQDLRIKPDLFVVASFGKILPKEILEIPKYGTLNVHPSLLPKLRGPSPIQTAILNGEKETGVTIMLMNEKMDEGPILAQQELRIKIQDLGFKKLEEELAKLGGKLLIETIPKWIDGKITPQPQDHNQATYSKLIKKSDGEINWNEPAEKIYNKICAFTPWPSAYYFENGKRVIITKTKLDKDGKLKILRVKPEGRNEMDFIDYK